MMLRARTRSSSAGRLAAAMVALLMLAACGSDASTTASSLASAAESKANSVASVAQSAAGSVASAAQSAAGSVASAAQSAANSVASAAQSKASSVGGAVSSAVAGAIGVASVNTTTGPLGTFLVDGDGKTLYLNTADSAGQPTCNDACAVTWPPLLTTGPPTATGGTEASLLSTVIRTNGENMVKYGDWPLYRFAADTNPGDTRGQGVQDAWYVVGVDGQPIK